MKEQKGEEITIFSDLDNPDYKELLEENTKYNEFFIEYLYGPQTLEDHYEVVQRTQNLEPFEYNHPEGIAWHSLSEEGKIRYIENENRELDLELHESYLDRQDKLFREVRRQEDYDLDPSGYFDKMIDEDEEAYDPTGRFCNQWKIGH